MFSQFNQPKDLFWEGYKTLQRGILIFGGSLVTLALLIFVFPALIGFLIATLILLAGGMFLVMGYQAWRFKKHIETLDFQREPISGDLRVERPGYHHRRFIWIIR